LGRAPGEALWPERFDIPELTRIRKQLGSYSFSAMYQQRPVPAEGGFFQRRWFRIADFAPTNLRWKRGYDLAVTKGANSDYTATARVGFDSDGNMYISHVFRKQMEYPEQRRYILGRINSEQDTEHGIEESANGQAVIQDLRRDRQLLGRKFRGVQVKESKSARALSWTALAEEGRLFLVKGAWNRDFITECCAFPLGKHDDQIDAVSIAVKMHTIHSSGTSRGYGF
jgi:predicted phage terminase large subunit-like protein